VRQFYLINHEQSRGTCHPSRRSPCCQSSDPGSFSRHGNSHLLYEAQWNSRGCRGTAEVVD
jgi:hypothetical protein